MILSITCILLSSFLRAIERGPGTAVRILIMMTMMMMTLILMMMTTIIIIILIIIVFMLIMFMIEMDKSYKPDARFFMMYGILQSDFDHLDNSIIIRFTFFDITNKIILFIIINIIITIIIIITCFLDWSVETCLEQALGGGLLDLIDQD